MHPAAASGDDAPCTHLSVVVPAYNERAGIVPVLDQLERVLRESALAWEIIVVDDGSTDGTAEAVGARGGVTLVRHARNRGYGAAVKTGIRRARHPWVGITDADGTYPNDRIPDLARAAGGAAMVVGARTAADARYPFLRKIPKVFLRAYAQWLTRAEIPDINSGLRLFRRDVAVRVLHLLPDGFSLTTTITMALLSIDEPVRFVPIGYAPRIGRSKIRPVRDTAGFLVLIVQLGTYFAPFRVFMPVAAILVLLLAASATYDVVVLGNLTDKTLILLTLTMNTAILALLADMIQKRVGR